MCEKKWASWKQKSIDFSEAKCETSYIGEKQEFYMGRNKKKEQYIYALLL